MITRTEARRIRAKMQTVSAGWDDKEASENVSWYPRMHYDGRLIAYQTRINWHGMLKMAKADLWDREENDPDHAPEMWADIAYKDGYRFIKENMSAAEAFALGERGWWEDELYESLINANVYTPATYPAGWRLVENA